MNPIDKVLDIARSQIGTTEYPPDSNNVKYNTAYYGREVWNGLWGCEFPWCVTFLWWCFNKAELSDLFYGGRKTAGCGTLSDYYIAKGQFVTYGYKKGDIVFFQFKGKEFQHVGIIESVNKDGTYTCIEGNTSNDAWGSQDNGGAVCRKVRLLMNICGAGRPNYEEDDYMTRDEILKELGDKWIATYDDLPNWAKPDVREMLDKEIINGGTDYSKNPDDINMFLSDIKNIIVAKRLIDAKK